MISEARPFPSTLSDNVIYVLPLKKFSFFSLKKKNGHNKKILCAHTCRRLRENTTSRRYQYEINCNINLSHKNYRALKKQSQKEMSVYDFNSIIIQEFNLSHFSQPKLLHDTDT